MHNKSELIFVVDPMCSWCWGFEPVVEALRKNHNHAYTFSLIMGGLRTKGALVWNEETKSFLKNTWQDVAKATGQTFTQALFIHEDFEYDTYPSCKAVISVRELFGVEEAFDYLQRIQQAFYVKGQDITNLEVLASFVPDSKREAFTDFFKSQRAQSLMEYDFAKARGMGANAFPSVVEIDQDGHMVCKKGYQHLESLVSSH